MLLKIEAAEITNETETKRAAHKLEKKMCVANYTRTTTTKQRRRKAAVELKWKNFCKENATQNSQTAAAWVAILMRASENAQQRETEL